MSEEKSEQNKAEEPQNFAVIKTGGKQYRVVPGQVISVELLQKSDREPEAKVNFSEVLLSRSGADIKVGTPFIDGASVSATVLKTEKGAKLFPFKKLRRKGMKKKIGHRQQYSTVRIEEISA